jgi:chromosome transmission fidelity protein 4
MNMETRDCRVLIDADCAITPGSVLTWMGFSEEGQIFTYDSDGILRSFSYTTQSWSVRLSFDTIRQRLQDSVRSIWIVGISDQEVLYIELGQDHEAPMLTQK